jgi:simple sugar transport system ATP-binding protein
LGSGRTEILRAITGFEPIGGGQIQVNGYTTTKPRPPQMLGHGVGMTPENRKDEGIIPEMGIDENMVLSNFKAVKHNGVISSTKVEAATDALRTQLSMKAPDLGLAIQTLSGGNQQKAVIGRWLFADSKVLLLDEPTHGVDVESKTQLYALVRDVAASGAAVVFVSSELEELPLVCDRVLVLRRGQIREEFRAPDINLSDLLTAAMTVEEM